MARSRSTRSRKGSLTSFKEMDGAHIAVIETTRVAGSGSRERALKRSDFLMPENLYMEKINHPITFETKEPEDALHMADPDDDIWPTAQPSRGVVVFGRHPGDVSVPPQWDEKSIHQSIRICRERGLVPGAIVAAKPLLGSGNDWKVKSFVYWGVVTGLN